MLRYFLSFASLLAASLSATGQTLLGDNLLPEIDSTANVWFSSPEKVRVKALDDVVLDYLNKAQHEILVNAYAITDIKIAKELARQQFIKRNSLRVYVIFEQHPSIRNYVVPSFLINSKVMVMYSDIGVNDSNYMIIDGKYVLTGAFNYTQAHSLKSMSNLHVLTDPKQITAYRNHFINHLALCTLPAEIPPADAASNRAELQSWFFPTTATAKTNTERRKVTSENELPLLPSLTKKEQ